MPKQKLAIEESGIFNKLRSFLNNEDGELNQKDKDILERWKFAYDQLQVEKKHQTAIRLNKLYGVTIRQAYLDINNARKLFNPLNRHDIEFERIWLVNQIRDDIMAAKKITNVQKRIQLTDRLYERYYRALGLDKDEIDRIDPELLGHNKLIAVFNVDNRTFEFNLDEVNGIKSSVREHLIDIMHQDITIEDAKELLDDGEQNSID